MRDELPTANLELKGEQKMVTGGSEQRQIRTRLKFPKRRITFVKRVRPAAIQRSRPATISRNSFLLAPKRQPRHPVFPMQRLLRVRPLRRAEALAPVPANSGPVILPPMVHGASFTCGLLRMRLYFPESLRVITYTLSSSSANHTGVFTARPLFRTWSTKCTSAPVSL